MAQGADSAALHKVCPRGYHSLQGLFQKAKRVFEIDINFCPLCGGQLRVIADVTDPGLIRKILDHVNSRAPPRLSPRRAESHQTPPDLLAER